jgi:hypothetical protein
MHFVIDYTEGNSKNIVKITSIFLLRSFLLL